MGAQSDHTPLVFTKLTLDDVREHIKLLKFPPLSTALVRQAIVYRFIQSFEIDPSRQLMLFNTAKKTVWLLM